jgi:hypothetical protein
MTWSFLGGDDVIISPVAAAARVDADADLLR